ncbi:IS4 family transposase [Vibrio fluvialis]|uniref:IS4 family transposase n=1 Tax=Vibrio TaxID=662 RepID=UPI001EEB5399|nr:MULTISPECIES: IS4 family transposase [Vibrio]MCG6357357.1 IS4 family transposase [Vibrio fluvialis]WGY47976.1 IS4 family transposase [Vibrio sp. ABG19]
MIKNNNDWAEEQFGHAKLGDPRRTARLVKMASDLAQHPGKSVVKSSPSPASMEGAYRFIRNDNVSSDDIAEAGFNATANQVHHYPLLLAIEDTTTLSYKHRSIRADLGHVNQGNRHRGLLAHSILLFAPETLDVVGLIEQQRWTRDIKTRGIRSQHLKRPYEEKEGYKWERASRNMAARLGDSMTNVISVCDREADIYDYLIYKMANQQRFVVRSMMSRHIEEGPDKLYHFASELKSVKQRQIQIAQRGGRKAREVTLDVKYAEVTLKVPSNKTGEPISLNYVGCSGVGDEDKKLNWHILTNEPVNSAEDALKIIAYYEKRWLIEEYHKVWKSEGTGVEELRVQSKDNLDRLATIYAFLAVRIFQLKFANEQVEDISCEKILSPRAWKLLWVKRIKTQLPEEVPTAKWAYEHLARLGGWKDSKRNGRASVKTLWEGWLKLQAILEGYELALSLEQDL